jgi:hypothetical protein
MELIDIIYNVLIFGVGLLIIVIASSYLLSRKSDLNRGGNQTSKIKNGTSDKLVNDKNTIAENTAVKHIYNRQSAKTNSTHYPKIFPLDQYKPKQVNVVRKQTFNKDFSHSELNTENLKSAKKSTGNGFRYTIINDNASFSDDSKVMQSY